MAFFNAAGAGGPPPGQASPLGALSLFGGSPMIPGTASAMGVSPFGPPPEPTPDPEPASKEFQIEAQEYVGNFCKASKAFVERKRDEFQKYQDLYLGNLSIWDWQKGVRPYTAYGVARSTILDGSIGTLQRERAELHRNLTDYVHPIAPLIHSFAHNAYLSIFQGPQYLTVISEDEQGGPTGDDQFPTQYKMEQLLLRLLGKGKIFSRVIWSLMHLPLFGTVAAKVYWQSRSIMRRKWDPATLQQIRTNEVVDQYPVIQPISLDRWLPDPAALHSDINLWRGAGHRVSRTYEDIGAAFDSGMYDLNRDEFDKLDGSGSPLTMKDSQSLQYDPDAQTEQDESQWFDIWEWHGRIPSKSMGRNVECCASFLTTLDGESPLDGTLIRLTTEPLLDSGTRPFVTCQYSEGDNAFGVGMVREAEDDLFLLSQFIGRLSDVARYTAVASLMAREGSRAMQWLDENGLILPGSCIPFDDPNEVKDGPKMTAPTGDVVQMIQLLTQSLQRTGDITDVYQGVSKQEQTATGMSILQRQSQAPTSTRTDLFARNFLEPAFNIALGMLQQFILTDQKIMVRDYGGQWRPITVTAEEIQRGKYTVKVVLTDQDHSRIAVAGTLERVMQNLPQYQQMVQADGGYISPGELFQEYLSVALPNASDRIYRVVGTREKTLQDQIQNLQQQLAQAQEKKPPSESISFKDLPPDGKVQMAAQAGIQLNPAELMAMPQPGTGVSGAPNGNGGAFPGPNGTQAGTPLMQHGGPMGSSPDDTNGFAQFLQMQAQQGQGGGMQ